MRTVAIIVAAGRGTRLGIDVPKAFVMLRAQPLVVYSLRTFADSPAVSAVVIAVPPAAEADGRDLLGRYGPWRCPVTIVSGGAERQDSVRAGLEAAGDAELIAVHDAARPFVTPTDLTRVVAAAADCGAAILAVPASDTVKYADAEGWIESTPDRGRTWLAQTPQVFRADLLRAAHAAAGDRSVATDDAMLVENLGTRVRIVPGDPGNRKITTRDDLHWAEWRLAHP